MKNLILAIIFFFTAINLQSQNPNFEWVKSNQGYYGKSTAISVALDKVGNIYLLGTFSGTVDFNPDPVNAYNITSPLDKNTSYIQKLDSNGNLIWVRTVDFEYGRLNKIEIDPNGSLYFIGNFEDTVDIDPGVGVYNLISNGDNDVLNLKLSANGNFVWAKSFGGINDDNVSDLITDSNGNIYSHVYFTGTCDFDPGPGVYNLSSMANNSKSAFVQKLDKNGNFVWAKAFVSLDTLSGVSHGKSIGIDSFDNVYCTGYFPGMVDFDPGSGILIPPSNAMGEYIVKLDSLGDYIWSKFSTYAYSWGFADPYDIEIDRYNNIYIAGTFRGHVDFDPGPDTLLLNGHLSGDSWPYIKKLTKDGDLIWAKSYGRGNSTVPVSITTDTFGNVYTIGYFKDSADLDPGFDTLVFYTQSVNWSSKGGYLQKLNLKGDILFAGVLEGNLGVSMGFDIAVKYANSIFLAGEFVDTVDFDPSSSIHNLVSANPPWASSYILKLSQCKVLTSDNVIACDSLIWIDGKTYYQSTQSAYFTLPSSVGCDSVICLNLNIPQIDTTISLSTNGASFIANQSNAKYQWLDCNNGNSPLLGDTLQIFTPTVNGDYAVEINLDACVDTSACVNISNVSIKETQLSMIKLYPNPNSGKFILDMGSLKAREIRILNSIGQEIFNVKDKNSQLFNLNLKPGVYIVQIFTENENASLRFVVE